MMELVIQYFEETCKNHPDNKAIVTEYDEISFRMLQIEAIQIANAIIKKQGQENRKPIFVYLPKNYKCIASFLAVLYAGDFYTPSDVNFPFYKIQGILDVLNPELYISDTKHMQILLEHGVNESQIINIDCVSNENKNIDLENGYGCSKAKDPVYVLFTSGSTGVPKGVEISNESVINFMEFIIHEFHINDQTILGNQAEFYFDLSCFDVFAMIGAGATLHIIPKALFTFPRKLVSYLAEKEINTIVWVPSALINVANAEVLDSVKNLNINKVLFCGEVLPVKHLNYWRKYLPDAMYVNMYGPTEATCACTYYTINREYTEDEVLPIGVAFPNTELYILNDDLKPVNTNEIGELCIASKQLANGYYNANDKTNEAFIDCSVNENKVRIYRTGDLVINNSKNEIEYVGRKDFQIKYKGFRIELGEIESVAYSCEQIKHVCAIFTDVITVYYVGNIEEKEFKKYLKSCLPKYMVPQRVIYLENMPLNSNGKVDRKNLVKSITIE